MGNGNLEILAKERGMELIKKVNQVAKAGLSGVEELRDIVNSFYDVCEVIEMKAEGKPITIGTIISEVVPGLLPSFMGIDQVVVEASDLQDSEIHDLVDSEAPNHELGDNALKYQQALKLLLFAIQSYFVFRA